MFAKYIQLDHLTLQSSTFLLDWFEKINRFLHSIANIALLNEIAHISLHSYPKELFLQIRKCSVDSLVIGELILVMHFL